MPCHNMPSHQPKEESHSCETLCHKFRFPQPLSRMYQAKECVASSMVAVWDEAHGKPSPAIVTFFVAAKF